MKKFWLAGLLPLTLASALAACNSPTEESTESSVPADVTDAPADAPEAIATQIVLPDGTACLHAGEGATLSYEDKRLNYTCGEKMSLIGDIVITNGTEMTVEAAMLDGPTLTGSEPITFTIAAIELTDGTTCLNAGQGATLAFGGKRVNYTCGGSEAGLMGDITAEGETFMVEKALLEGTELASSETAIIRVISAVTP